MKRYQVYLNPGSVSIIDDFTGNIDLSRSRLIQMAVDQIMHNLLKIFRATQTPPKKTYIMDSLVGIIKVKGRKQTNFAENIDEIYLQD